ncbi:MAG: acyl-CoA thioesterase [Alphaproteobacteria bacterium]|nr:acyl-CoA thioesterase [Alphaproteobacteria bacterium]
MAKKATTAKKPKATSKKPSPAKVTYKGCVYPWQCDHVGHMNVMWYVGKFDEATWNFFASLGLTPDYFREHHCGMAAVQQNITYKRELMPGDVVEIRTRLIEMRSRVIRFEHVMTLGEEGDVAAVCDLTGVHLDRQARKSIPFPETILKGVAP